MATKVSIKECQYAEFKQSWQDEYLKWICAFANTEGGSLFVGVDDKGYVCGVKNAHKLSEDIPNKIRNTMGVICEMRLLNAGGLDYFEIKVDKYPVPISYRGRYYKRSGSTVQELSGVEINRLTLFMQGRTWDSVPVPGISTKELDHGALKLFREKAVESQRLDKKAAGVSVQNLLQNLRCTEGCHLTRAAMMCFHPDPESWVTRAYIKIGFFPPDAFRELLLNAVVHKDYTETTPIQIKIYSDRIWMWNPGNMPEEVKVKDLFKKHVSKPRNPNIANVFFKSGYVESWGRGYYNIELACEETDSKLPKPKAEFGGLTVECRASDQYKELASKWNIGGVNPPINPPINKTQQVLLDLIKESNNYTYDNLASLTNKHRDTVRENLKKLQELGLIRRVGARKNGHWEIIEK